MFGRISSRRAADRRYAPRAVMPHGRFRACKVEIRIAGQVEEQLPAAGRAFLHDLTPEGLGLFAEQRFDHGAEVELVIEGPKILYLRGRIAWCGPSHTTARVIRQLELPYRIGVALRFDDADERRAVEQYCRDLAITPKQQLSDSARRISMLASHLSRVCMVADSPNDRFVVARMTENEIEAAIAQVKRHPMTPDWNRRVDIAVQRLSR